METHAKIAQIIDGPGVHIETQALDQLERVAGLDGCVRAVGMPDLHPGPGIPIGAAIALDHVRPLMVGSDAGCGASVTLVQTKSKLDQLERRLRAAFSEPPLAGGLAEDAARAAWAKGTAGLAELPSLPEDLIELAARRTAPETVATTAPIPNDWPLPELGSIGGGNHFAEVGLVEDLRDGTWARAKGIKKAAVSVLVHTGSRGIGAALHNKWGDRVLGHASTEAANYLADLQGAVRFAEANRVVITWRILRALRAARASKIDADFDVTHNTVTRHENTWLHRKGAAPAAQGQLTVVLGSRGAPSWILRGSGNNKTLSSVAHGAGRRFTRADAVARFKQTKTRKEVTRTSIGSRVICDNPKLLFEEHPDAYKPIEPIVAAIEAHGMATRVAALRPLITVKK